jgi:PBP4 family serine-type D-alanyl-D-alanine carboxypeptidase
MSSSESIRSSQGLIEAIRKITEREDFAGARFGVAAHDVAEGQALFEENACQLFPAASTTKIPTSIYALALLGQQFRFRTRVVRCGPMDGEGTLHGDLVLVASGDPNLSGRVASGDKLDFRDIDHSYGGAIAQLVERNPLQIIDLFARGVRAAGIFRITGTVLVDVHLFEEGYRETGTFTIVSPIAVNDNQIDLEIMPGKSEGDAAHLRLWPRSGYVRFINRVTTGAGGSEPAIRVSAEQRESDGTHSVTVTGKVPVGAPSMAKLAVESPSRFARTLLVEALAVAGIVVEGGLSGQSVTSRATPDDAPTIVEHISAPLSEVTKVELKVSQNLHAEMLIRVVGAVCAAAHGAEAASAGFVCGRDLLQKWGVETTGACQGDACGANGFFSPDFMCRLLVRVAASDVYDSFLLGLPVMGRDGTLWDVQPNSGAAGRVVAKTGTLICNDLLNNSLLFTGKGLAGYVSARSGRRVAFCIYLNNYLRVPPSKLDPGHVLGELATAIYEHL